MHRHLLVLLFELLLELGDGGLDIGLVLSASQAAVTGTGPAHELCGVAGAVATASRQGREQRGSEVGRRAVSRPFRPPRPRAFRDLEHEPTKKRQHDEQYRQREEHEEAELRELLEVDRARPVLQPS
tara:strand:- start:412 stop:792 length:381 start_codon:yes stop_codon:yes gene_type:complete